MKVKEKILPIEITKTSVINFFVSDFGKFTTFVIPGKTNSVVITCPTVWNTYFSYVLF